MAGYKDCESKTGVKVLKCPINMEVIASVAMERKKRRQAPATSKMGTSWLVYHCSCGSCN